MTFFPLNNPSCVRTMINGEAHVSHLHKNDFLRIKDDEFDSIQIFVTKILSMNHGNIQGGSGFLSMRSK